MANDLSYEQFVQRFADCEDDLVSDLVYLLEHEPQRGGVFGVNETEWAQYKSRLTTAISAMERLSKSQDSTLSKTAHAATSFRYLGSSPGW